MIEKLQLTPEGVIQIPKEDKRTWEAMKRAPGGFNEHFKLEQTDKPLERKVVVREKE